ncbi:MAG: electron transport complex subunit RsxC [Spongiibacteraceae bacterium]
MNAPLWPMRGGITPPPNKQQSNAAPIRFAGIPPELIFPLSQRHSAAIPVVATGQQVLKGELIARAGDEFGAPLHASSSGEIIAIETRAIAHETAHTSRCIVLRTDGNDSWRERYPIVDFAQVDATQLIERIRHAGVIGAGGAGFPAARKLIGDKNQPQSISTLIINGAECEPYITADDRLMRERAHEIVQGIRVLQQILQPQKTLFGIEDEQADALTAMRAATIGTDIHVVAVPTLYPTGGEGQLIQVLTGNEVPAAGNPADIGVLCFNVGTAAAIYRAVVLDEPMLSRIVTISGRACSHNGNFEVLIGTPLPALLAQAGYNAAINTTLIAGGAMMGLPLKTADIPITKTSHCFIAGTAEEFPQLPAAQACIRCGYCSEVCPAALLPQQLYAHARAGNDLQLHAHHLFDCIECGACDFICPSHIPLAQQFRDAKHELRVLAFEQLQAPIAKQRFIAHQARTARQQQERELSRQQRLRNTAGLEPEAVPQPDTSTPAAEDNKKAAIQAAIARAKAKKAGAPQRPADDQHKP